MRTVVEPQQHIAALWSKPEVRDGETFRMMRYVLRVDHEGKVLLHNVVTGQLVVLDQDEAELVEKLPTKYNSSMEQLVDGHYLVPEQFDEHRRVVKIREVLRKLIQEKHIPITQYKILPTTACNARCYYCFEHGIKSVTMTEKTATDVVNFIVSKCETKKINITWFGGEPTVAADRIDQISRELKERNIVFSSDMISNGYLFNEKMVERAKDLWELKSIQITVDGTEKNSNKTKAFSGISDNPYQRVLRNIELLLKEEIHVGLRMNFDISNYTDFKELLDEIADRFGMNRFLQVYAYPVIGEYVNHDGVILHGDDQWMRDKLVELNDMARERKQYKMKDALPFLCFIGCEPDRDDSVIITPEGKLARCGEQICDEQTVGSITEGFTNQQLIDSWKVFGDYEICKRCPFFPKCVRMEKCAAKERCYYQDRNHQYVEAIKRRFMVWKTNNELKGGNEYAS